LDNLANAIAVLFLLHFCWSYYWNCYRKGYTIDLWHYSLLNTLFIIHVMLPFARSNLNIFALGWLLQRTQGHVNEAYFISAFGYFFILVGGELWRVNLGTGLRSSAAHVLELPARATLLLTNSRSLLLVHTAVILTLSTAILGYYWSMAGFGFNLRGLLLVVTWLRPIAQFTAFYAITVGGYTLGRFYIYRERSMLVASLLLIVSQVFWGERSNSVAMIMLSVMVAFIRLGRRIRLWWLIGGVSALLSISVLLDGLREPVFSLSQTIGTFGLKTLYGNSFSDIRDFALILSFWNGEHFLGLTYLAGIFAFIPRFLSPFRDTWALGVVTARMAGFLPTEHPGLRVGMFGEAYLNFGLPGAMLLGLLSGAVLRLMDSRMKQAVKLLPATSMVPYAYLTVGVWSSVAVNSVGAGAVYSFFLILLASWVILHVARLLRVRLVN
jgi:hypothetical protein